MARPFPSWRGGTPRLDLAPFATRRRAQTPVARSLHRWGRTPGPRHAARLSLCGGCLCGPPSCRRAPRRIAFFEHTAFRIAPWVAQRDPGPRRNCGQGKTMERTPMPAQTSSEEERELVETARGVLPGGGFGNVTHEVIIAEGKGGHVWDVSGNEYIDYLLGSGPMIVGHAHPEVTEVVQQIAAKGTTFFANNPYGIRLAAEIVDAVACAEKVRFVSSGSEADAYAIRLARAYKKRDKILKF